MLNDEDHILLLLLRLNREFASQLPAMSMGWYRTLLPLCILTLLAASGNALLSLAMMSFSLWSVGTKLLCL